MYTGIVQVHREIHVQVHIWENLDAHVLYMIQTGKHLEFKIVHVFIAKLNKYKLYLSRGTHNFEILLNLVHNVHILYRNLFLNGTHVRTLYLYWGRQCNFKVLWPSAKIKSFKK